MTTPAPDIRPKQSNRGRASSPRRPRGKPRGSRTTFLLDGSYQNVPAPLPPALTLTPPSPPTSLPSHSSNMSAPLIKRTMDPMHTSFGTTGKTKKSFKLASQLVYKRAADFVTMIVGGVISTYVVPIVEILHDHETNHYYFDAANDLNEPFIVRVEDIGERRVLSREAMGLLPVKDDRFLTVLLELMKYCIKKQIAWTFFAQERRYTRGSDIDIGFVQKTTERITPPVYLFATAYVLAFNAFETSLRLKENNNDTSSVTLRHAHHVVASVPFPRGGLSLAASSRLPMAPTSMSAPVPSPRSDSSFYESGYDSRATTDDDGYTSDYTTDEIDRFYGPRVTTSTPPTSSPIDEEEPVAVAEDEEGEDEAEEETTVVENS